MSENKKIKIAIDTLGGDHGKSGFGSYILYFISNLPKDADFEIFSKKAERHCCHSAGIVSRNVRIEKRIDEKRDKIQKSTQTGLLYK